MRFPHYFVYVIGLLIGVSYGMHGPILPVFAKNVIGASYVELGFIGLANFIPYMFIPVFVGILLDRINNGYLLSIGVIINTASIFLLSISQTVTEVMIFRIMTGIAHAFFWPPSESIISKTSSVEDRVKNIAKFTGFFVTGFMIGPLLGTMFLENFDVSYRLLFQITAYVLASALISSLIISKKNVKNSHGKFSFSSIKQIAKFPEVILMLIFCTSSFGMILTIFPAFLDDRMMSATDIELLFFIFGVSRVITLVCAGKLAKNTSLTLICAAALISVGLVISFLSHSFVEFAISLLMMGFGFSIFFPLTLEIILSKTKREISGTVIGAYEATFGIGWAIGPITAGLISQFFGNSSPYLFFFIFGIGVTLFGILKRKSLEPQRKATAS